MFIGSGTHDVTVYRLKETFHICFSASFLVMVWGLKPGYAVVFFSDDAVKAGNHVDGYFEGGHFICAGYDALKTMSFSEQHLSGTLRCLIETDLLVRKFEPLHKSLETRIATQVVEERLLSYVW